MYKDNTLGAVSPAFSVPPGHNKPLAFYRPPPKVLLNKVCPAEVCMLSEVKWACADAANIMATLLQQIKFRENCYGILAFRCENGNKC